MSGSLRFPRSLRLRRSADFRVAQREGRRAHAALFVVVWRPNGLSHPRFGLAVSRKVGGAVVRNKVKRWIREAVRHERGALTGVDVVFIARPNAAGSSAAEVRRAVRHSLGRLGKR